MKIILEADLSGDISEQTDCFPDVHDEWYAKYVCYAKEHAIIKGYNDGTFKPGQNVIIAEALKISLESFNETIDQSSKTTWYEPYINFVHNNSIFSKYALLPTKEMTRGEMAYLIHQLLLQKEGKIQFTGIRNVKSL
ncbi:TPA: hypothetical protein DEP21_01560 [Patescibacteria group bacterium]|nr:hypothetical protein [Candidatus Gracilibacteria bacterium]